MDEIQKQERAYELLQWTSRAPLAPFDQDLAESGFYASVWAKQSDQALDAWDKDNPYEQGAELKAFYELERRGFYTQADFFSPDKASGCIRWVDPNDPSKGEHPTCLTYTETLKRERHNQTHKQDHSHEFNRFEQRTERSKSNPQKGRRGVSTADGLSDRRTQGIRENTSEGLPGSRLAGEDAQQSSASKSRVRLQRSRFRRLSQ